MSTSKRGSTSTSTRGQLRQYIHFEAKGQIVDLGDNPEPIRKSKFTRGAKSNLKNNKAMFFEGGISGKGYFGKVGTTVLLSKQIYINVDFLYENAKASDFNFSTLNFTGTFFWTPFKPIRNMIYINGGVGICGNRSSIKNVEVDENNKVTSLNTMDLGSLVGLETETFMTNKIAWIVSADQRWFLTNNFAKTKKDKTVNTFFVGTGIRLFL